MNCLKKQDRRKSMQLIKLLSVICYKLLVMPAGGMPLAEDMAESVKGTGKLGNGKMKKRQKIKVKKIWLGEEERGGKGFRILNFGFLISWKQGK
jgi:hypothetical protein